MPHSSLDFLIKKSAEFEITVLHRDRAQVELEVPVARADGLAPVYHLVLEAVGALVSVKERVPTRLPASCPERHINSNGTFCLGWAAVDDLTVHDEESADAFLTKLLKFLKLQERATRLRRWPDHRAWAHGDAASYQRRAIEAAKALSPALGRAAQRGKLSFRRQGSGVLGSALQVFSGEKWIFSVWEREKRPVNLRRPCICDGTEGERHILKKCSDHKDQAVRLAFALRDQRKAEERFWKSYKGQACCGTLDDCPLKI